MGDLDEARDSFRKALDLDPGNIAALTNLADYYCRRRKWAEAEVLLRKAIEFEPENPQWYINLGKFYDLIGRRGEADEAYSRAEALKKNR